MFKNLAIFACFVLFGSKLVLGTENKSNTQNSSSKTATDSEKRSEMSEYVKHHTKDVHDFHIFSDNSENTHYGFPLPVILWDGEIHFFMSSAFHHGEHVVESKGKFFKLSHDGKIYGTNQEGNVWLSTPLDLSITKSVFITLIIAFILFFVFKGMADSYKNSLSPKGVAKFFEPLVLFVRDDIAIPNIGVKHYKKYMVYLLTVFFFIWFLNLVGMTPFGVNVTGNIAVTFTLAILTFIITQSTANANYWKHIFWMPGVPTPMKVLLAPIELLGVFIKPFALMIRLYANMLAGHIVIGSLISLLFVFHNWGAKGAFLGLTLFLNIVELLVTFLQAYIFTMLTALYFGFAVEEHDEHH